VGLLAGDQELGGVGAGVQRISGDHHTGQVQVGQQRPEAGNLAGCAVDVSLGQDGASGLVHRGQRVDLPALGAAAAQPLAVDRDRPSPLLLARVVAVGQPGADRGGQGGGVTPGQGAADRGFAGDHPHPVAGAGMAAGTQRGTHGLGGVGGPLGDRGDRPRARQDRGSGQHQDGDQPVPTPAAGPGVGHGGEVGEQVRCLGWSQRLSVAQCGQAEGDRG
jgi:hypothetical protein